MTRKSDQTTLFILEKVAPIFNKKGFNGTSMEDITSAVGMTKGAIYGNFKDKKELAIKAFSYNVRKVMEPLASKIKAKDSPLEKLYAITDFYRDYADFMHLNGGCPILNIGVDANNQDEQLLAKVRDVIRKLEKSMADIIIQGMACGEMKTGLDAQLYGKRLYAMIQGAIFMTLTLNDKSYIMDMMNHIDNMITRELTITS